MNSQTVARAKKIIDFLKASDVQIEEDSYFQEWYPGCYDITFNAKTPGHKYYTPILLTRHTFYESGTVATCGPMRYHSFSVCYVGDPCRRENGFNVFGVDARLIAMEIEERLKRTLDTE